MSERHEAPVWGIPGIRPLTSAEFALLRGLIYREAGIHLCEAKKALLVARLSQRIRELGLASFRQYYDYVTRGPDPHEMRRMLERICTHETHFFREPRQFEFLERTVFPEWRASGPGDGPRRLRAWSAGCSTGQEPYSLAMLLLSSFPRDRGWSLEVVGTDLSERALTTAREAIWSIDRLDEIPMPYRRRFMLRGIRGQAGRMRAGPELRSVVRFRRLNLNDPEYDLEGRFDLIFCRNVLIYFDEQSRERAVQKLSERLAPGGYLFVGHAETLHRASPWLRSSGPAAYRLAPRHSNDGEPAAGAEQSPGNAP